MGNHGYRFYGFSLLFSLWFFPTLGIVCALQNCYSHCTKNAQKTADLVTFTEEILNGKLHFLCCVICELLTNVLDNFSINICSNIALTKKKLLLILVITGDNTCIFSCYGASDRQIKVSTGEHISILP